MRRLVFLFLSAALLGLAIFWSVTAPHHVPEQAYSGLSGDPDRGRLIYTAAGCASCHMAPGAEGEARDLLVGGQAFASDFGTFYAPNITPDSAAGIGGWTVVQLADALTQGVSPDGQHYYPALPYWSYSKMAAQDIADLHAFLMTLPADATPSQPHEIGFPFNIRRLLGGWKFLNMDENFVLQGSLTETETRGRYIAEALAHCGECHTPRNAIGGLDTASWLAGATNPDGKGRTPNITPAKLAWSEDEIVEYLTSGFTPEFDSVGGHMAHVVDNMSKLSEDDRRAVAAYLKKVPGVE